VDPGRFRVLTFDCYGTLIDWETGILSALRPVLAAHGLSRDDQAILRLYARLESELERGDYLPYRAILRRVVDGFGSELGFVPTSRQRSALDGSIGEWPPFPDTVDALRALAARYRLGIISNVDDDLFAGTAEKLGIPFDCVVTAQQVGAYKPSRRMFETAIARLGADRPTILHVAQSAYHDVVPARRSGLATVLVRRRGFGAAPPSEAVADLEVPDLASLITALLTT